MAVVGAKSYGVGADEELCLVFHRRVDLVDRTHPQHCRCLDSRYEMVFVEEVATQRHLAAPLSFRCPVRGETVVPTCVIRYIDAVAVRTGYFHYVPVEAPALLKGAAVEDGLHLRCRRQGERPSLTAAPLIEGAVPDGTADVADHITEGAVRLVVPCVFVGKLLRELSSDIQVRPFHGQAEVYGVERMENLYFRGIGDYRVALPVVVLV